MLDHLSRAAAHLIIRSYQLSLSALVGRQCRHVPSCSTYTDEAIQRHGVWAGGWIGAARVCRCHPWGTAGFDPVPDRIAGSARWFRPWRYGTWRWREAAEPHPADSDRDHPREALVNGLFRNCSDADS